MLTRLMKWSSKDFKVSGKTYLSADTIGEDNVHHVYPTDFINSLTPSGMSPHAMTLNVDAPVMLLRNLHAGPGNGL